MRSPPLWIPVLAALLTAPAACDDDGPQPVRHPTRMTVWAEFMEPAQANEWFAFAAANHLNVNIAVAQETHDRDYVSTACRAAQDHDVALRLWPLLTEANGYWPNQGNVEEFIAWVHTLRDWARTDCPRLDGFVVDLELPIDRAREIEDMFDQGATATDLVTYLLEGVDEAQYERARERFNDLVTELTADGYLVSASTLAMLADDPLDGDESIAKALWTPVEGIPWEKLSFQIYRSHFIQLWGQGISDEPVDFPSGLITSYARSILEFYGDQGAIDLGTVGTAGIGTATGLPTASELQADIAAAMAEGIPPGRIHIYSLDGLFEFPDRADWIAVPEPVAAPIDASTMEMRDLFATLDLLGN